MKARTFLLPLLLGGLILALKLGVAQTAPAAVGPRVLDVVVTDKSDRPVAGLQTSDFKVLDNNQQRNVIGVRQVDGESPKSDPPVQAYLLVDMVNNSIDEMAATRKNIADYLRAGGGHLTVPTSLVFLTSTRLKFQEQPTQDANVLLDNLEKNPPPQRIYERHGGGGEEEEMREESLRGLNGLALRLRDKPGRKLVVWISPGWASFSPGSDRKSLKELDALFNYIVGITTVLREARITLYSIDPNGTPDYPELFVGARYKEYLKGVATPKQSNNGDLFLQVIATQTGGRVLYGSNNVAKMIDQCFADAESFYVLSYDAPAANTENEYHGIQILVSKPGLKARTITGFYAQP